MKLARMQMKVEENMKSNEYNNSQVNISTLDITGLVNPKLVIRGDATDVQILVSSKGKPIACELMKIGHEFEATADIERNQKIVDIVFEKDGVVIEERRILNSVLKRVGSRVKASIRKPLVYSLGVIVKFAKGIRFLWREHHFLVPPQLWKEYLKQFKHGRASINFAFWSIFNQKEYLKWLEINETFNEVQEYEYNPLISVLIPVYNVEPKILEECLESVLSQTYKNFEICIADDCSTNEDTITILKKFEQLDERIRIVYRKENGHISKASNSALALAKGEFCALLDNDDILSPHAFNEVVRRLNIDKDIDFLYSDEDKLDEKGVRCEPHFKPDYSPDTLMSLNYICHLSVIRSELIRKVGGFQVGLEGSQDYDLFLKISEQTKNIYHISKILYHWRKVRGSTSMTISSKSYAIDCGKRTLENALERRGTKGKIEIDDASMYYRVKYCIGEKPKISILIPTRDHADILQVCVESIYRKSSYKNFEIIVLNNQSSEPETFDLFNEYEQKYNNFKVVDVNAEFNYSYINNVGVESAEGEYILLLNNDTEVITETWLEDMLGYAMLPHIGAVGAKLLYPDTTVQHCGVIMGLGGVASHGSCGEERKHLGLYGRLRVPYNYAAVTAACLMISKVKFELVGGLEEALTVAYNDVDLNMKLLEAGYYNICLPQVELTHFESKSRGADTEGEKYKRFLKEQEYMYEKWSAYIKRDAFYNSNFSQKYWYVLDKGKSSKE